MVKEIPPEGSIEDFKKGIWGERKKLVICLEAG